MSTDDDDRSTGWTARRPGLTMLLCLLAMAGIAGWGGFTRATWPRPRLLAEGVIDDGAWSVVQVKKSNDQCLQLRHDGVRSAMGCEPHVRLQQQAFYQLSVIVLTGTSQPLLFGLLPDQAARAEVALDGKDTLQMPFNLGPRPDPNRPFAPVQVRTFSGSRRFLVETAPANRTVDDRHWHGGFVDVRVFDGAGRELLPNRRS